MSTPAEIDFAARTVAWGVLNPGCLETGERVTDPIQALDPEDQGKAIRASMDFIFRGVATLRGPA